MNIKLSRLLARIAAVLALVGSGTFGATEVLAGDKYRRHDGQEYRGHELGRSNNRHERDRRAFIAGAAAQQHRDDDRNYYRNNDRYRDGYRDRYSEHYDDNHDHNNVGSVLVGAAVGAVATGLIMNSRDNSSKY